MRKKMIAVICGAVSCAAGLTMVPVPVRAASANSSDWVVVRKGTIEEEEIMRNIQPAGQVPDGTRVVNVRMQAMRAAKSTRKKSGRLSYTIAYDRKQFRYQKGKTTLRTRMTWQWSRAPRCLFTDVAAMTTSHRFMKTSSSGTVTYYRGGRAGMGKKTVRLHVQTKNTGQGIFGTIPMVKQWDHYRHAPKHIAMKGTMQTRWKASGKINYTGIAANYGHTVISSRPNVSFGLSGASISFSPGNKVKYGTEAYQGISR